MSWYWWVLCYLAIGWVGAFVAGCALGAGEDRKAEEENIGWAIFVAYLWPIALVIYTPCGAYMLGCALYDRMLQRRRWKIRAADEATKLLKEEGLDL